MLSMSLNKSFPSFPSGIIWHSWLSKNKNLKLQYHFKLACLKYLWSDQALLPMIPADKTTLINTATEHILHWKSLMSPQWTKLKTATASSSLSSCAVWWDGCHILCKHKESLLPTVKSISYTKYTASQFTTCQKVNLSDHSYQYCNDVPQK